jgi:hypothetical protein
MRNLLTAVICSTVLASSAWASITACPGISGTPTETLATINANTPGGCQVVDKQFSNFTTTPVGQISTIEMLNTSTAGTVGSNTITGLLLNYDAPGIWQTAANSTTTSVFNYQGTIDQTFSPPATGVWTISQLTLVVNTNPANSADFKNGDTVTVRMEWCPGATTVTGCANLQFIQGVLSKVGGGPITLVYTNSSGSGNGLDVTAFNDSTIFAVRNTLTFVGTSPQSAYVLSGISNGFDELGVAPEPSTFVLFGIALAGVGALRHRRRKTA